MRSNRMKKDWDKKGSENPYYWSVTSNKNWDPVAFYATGKEDVDTFLTPLFVGKDTSSMSALDIGCATGRMTRHMKFGRVVGVDISQGMIDQAHKDNPQQEYYVIDGKSLAGLSAEDFDFVFSHSTLNHLTQMSYLEDMFNEIYRVLKKGGTARINVRGNPASPRGVVIWWKSFNRGYFALTKIRGLVVPYWRFFDSLGGVSVKEHQLRSMTKQFARATPLWLGAGKHRSLWIDLEK
jgi:SAM-dependent methyltransferase